jgi:hypothetical protein
MKVKPWMYGVGVLGVAGVGIALYEVFKSKPAAAGGSTGGSLKPAGVPSIGGVTRPDAPSGGAVFGVYPTGPVFNLTDSRALSASSLTSGQNLTLALPGGAVWTAVVAGNTANPNVALGQVDLGGNTSSPISIPANSLVGANAVMAGWIDGSNVHHVTNVAIPLITHVLHLSLRP